MRISSGVDVLALVDLIPRLIAHHDRPGIGQADVQEARAQIAHGRRIAGSGVDLNVIRHHPGIGELTNSVWGRCRLRDAGAALDCAVATWLVTASIMNNPMNSAAENLTTFTTTLHM